MLRERPSSRHELHRVVDEPHREWKKTVSEEEEASARPQSRVPSGRLSRFLQLSAAATQMAAAGAKEKVKRLAERAEEELPHVLLTAESARLLATRLSRLRGAAMKVGQMLSLEGGNLLPKEFAQALEILRSSAHTMPEAQVREVLRTEYGPDWQARFDSLELVPMASASIGQVHRAVTLDGRRIVLKMQYPGVAESIDSDVDNLRSLLALARIVPPTIDLDDFVAEVKRELRQEVDYLKELDKLERYASAVAGSPELVTPKPVRELSTKHVLAMEYVAGTPLLDWAKAASQSERDAVAERLFDLLLRELFEFGVSQTDPNPANYLIDGERLVLLDFGAARAVPPDVADVYRRALAGLGLEDRELLRTVLVDLGVHNESVPEATEYILDLALLGGEVLRPGPYDFAATDLQKRLNERGRGMIQFHGKLGAPPPEYLFFQRKLGGTFLLCRQLGARVDCRKLLERRGVLPAS